MPKKTVFLAAILAFVCVVPPVTAATVDEIVAIVDDEVILRSDLMRELGPLMGSLGSAGGTEEEIMAQLEQAMEDVLDQAIEGRLLYKEALLLGADLDDRAIDERLQEIQKQYDSYDAFLQALRDAGETMSDLRNQVRRQMLAISVAVAKREQFEEQAVVTEADMRQYYQDNIDTFNLPERVQVRRIFLTAANDRAARAEAGARLEALRGEVEQGASFADLARAHSEGPDADRGGLVGWVQRGDLVGELENAAFATEPGRMGEIVETEFGVHLLMVEAREAAGAASYDEVRTEIEPLLRFKYAEERYRRWMRDLRSRSRVQVFI